MSYLNFLPYLFVMAGATYLIRMIPLVLFKKKITNRFFLSLLHYIPFALILALKNKSLLIVAIGATCGALITELIIKFI